MRKRWGIHTFPHRKSGYFAVVTCGSTKSDSMYKHLKSLLKIKSLQEDSIPALFGILACLRGTFPLTSPLLDALVLEYATLIEGKKGLFEFKHNLKARVEHLLEVKESRWWVVEQGSCAHETHCFNPLAWPAPDKDSALDHYLYGKDQ